VGRQKRLQAPRRQFLRKFHPPLVFYQVNQRTRRHTISKTVLVLIALSPKNLTKIMVKTNAAEAAHRRARINQGKIIGNTTTITKAAKKTKPQKEMTRANLSGIIMTTIKVLNKIKIKR